MPNQVKNMSNRHKVICGGEVCIYAYMMHDKLNAWRSRKISKLVSVYQISCSIISIWERRKKWWLH